MALLALPHGDAGTVPEALFSFRGFIIIVPAGAQGGAEFVFVLGQPLDDDGGDGFVDAEVGAGAGGKGGWV